MIQPSICDGLSGCASLCPPGPHRGDPDLTEASCQNLRIYLITRWFCASSTFLYLNSCCTIEHVRLGVLRPDHGLALSPATSCPTHRASLCSPNMPPTFSPLLFYFCSAICSVCKSLSIPFHLANSYHPSWSRKTLSPTCIPKECILPTALRHTSARHWSLALWVFAYIPAPWLPVAASLAGVCFYLSGYSSTYSIVAPQMFAEWINTGI